MAGFGGAVAKDAVIHQGRVQAGGHQGSGADDEAVDQEQRPGLGAGQHGAGHHGDFETAELGQRRQGLGATGRQAGPGGGLDQQLPLAAQARIVQPRAPADAIAQGNPGQDMGEQGGGGGIADAHFAKAQHIAALGDQGPGHLGAAFEGGIPLFRTHGGGCDEVGGARGDLGLHQAGTGRKVVGNARIHHRQGQAVGAAKTLMAAPPARKFSTICQVTSWG